jgi:hypothetical protein
VLLLGLLPAMGWMAYAPLSSAVVAQAFVKVDLDRRPVQHAEGGIVREVRVRDGQQVAQGEALLVLGDVAVDADVNRLNLRVQTERAGMARLDAEQLAARSLSFPADLLAAAQNDTRLAEQLAKERALFDARVSCVSRLRGMRLSPACHALSPACHALSPACHASLAWVSCVRSSDAVASTLLCSSTRYRHAPHVLGFGWQRAEDPQRREFVGRPNVRRRAWKASWRELHARVPRLQ